MTDRMAESDAVKDGTTCPLCGFHWDAEFDVTEHVERFCPKRPGYVPKSGMVLDQEAEAGTVTFGFSAWPAEGGSWEPSMFTLFRQLPRVEVDMTDDEWSAFSSSLERQGITVREVERHAERDVTIGKNKRGAWCVLIDGEVVSTHRSRDGAATSANNHIRAAQ